MSKKGLHIGRTMIVLDEVRQRSAVHDSELSGGTTLDMEAA